MRREAWAVKRSERRDEAAVLEERIADLHRQLDGIEELWLSSTVKDSDARERLGRRRLTAESELAELGRQLSKIAGRARGARLDALYSEDGCVVEAFMASPPHVQVSVMHELIDKVVLCPTSTNKWDPGRAVIVWASD